MKIRKKLPFFLCSFVFDLVLVCFFTFLELLRGDFIAPEQKYMTYRSILYIHLPG